MEDFIYERLWLQGSIKLELVTGGSRYHGRVWREIARQIYCESGKDGFRELGHFKSGAPFICDENVRISISHTDGCLAVATIKVPEDSDLQKFSPETALGVDVERKDRRKALSVRERFLTDEEQAIVPADSIEANVTAWTCKEAMLKAGMNPDIDWHRDIVIESLPTPGGTLGKGRILIDGVFRPLALRTMAYGSFIVTTAAAPGV